MVHPSRGLCAATHRSKVRSAAGADRWLHSGKLIEPQWPRGTITSSRTPAFSLYSNFKLIAGRRISA
jgi:hypothetical protein